MRPSDNYGNFAQSPTVRRPHWWGLIDVFVVIWSQTCSNWQAFVMYLWMNSIKCVWGGRACAPSAHQPRGHRSMGCLRSQPHGSLLPWAENQKVSTNPKTCPSVFRALLECLSRWLLGALVAHWNEHNQRGEGHGFTWHSTAKLCKKLLQAYSFPLITVLNIWRKVSHLRDVFWKGNCDEGCMKLASLLGWEEELERMVLEGPPSSKLL